MITINYSVRNQHSCTELMFIVVASRPNGCVRCLVAFWVGVLVNWWHDGVTAIPLLWFDMAVCVWQRLRFTSVAWLSRIDGAHRLSALCSLRDLPRQSVRIYVCTWPYAHCRVDRVTRLCCPLCEAALSSCAFCERGVSQFSVACVRVWLRVYVKMKCMWEFALHDIDQYGQ